MFLIFAVGGDSTIFFNVLLILFRFNLAVKTASTSVITTFKNPTGKKKEMKIFVKIF